MPTGTTLSRLRRIRDAERRAEQLREDEDRDGLIRKAVEEGHSEEQVAIAAGLTQPRVHQIVKGE